MDIKISDKILKIEKVYNKERHCILIKVSIKQEDKTIINICASKYVKLKLTELKGEIKQFYNNSWMLQDPLSQ